MAEGISGRALIETLHRVFSGFDRLIVERGGTKIKTVGDAYMAVFGARRIAPHESPVVIEEARSRTIGGFGSARRSDERDET